MATFSVRNLNGDTVGNIDLSDDVFGVRVNEDLLYEVVKNQLANRRSGTACTKLRKEIVGGKKKIYRQKGTGGARHGGRNAPTFVGGGQTFGPRPRSYAYVVPKKARQGALRSVLSLRAKEQKLIIVEDLGLKEIKTKTLVQVLAKFQAPAALIVEDKGNEKLVASARNLADTKWIATEGINVYDVLKHPHLVMTRAVAQQLDQRLKP
jgi:large subunit ribosomal protein L4